MTREHFLQIVRVAAEQLQQRGWSLEDMTSYNDGKLHPPSKIVSSLPPRFLMRELSDYFGGQFVDPLPSAVDLANLARATTPPPHHFWAALSTLFLLGQDTVLYAGALPDPREFSTIEEVQRLLTLCLWKTGLLLDRLIPALPQQLENIVAAIQGLDPAMGLSLRKILDNLTAVMMATGLKPKPSAYPDLPLQVSEDRVAAIEAIRGLTGGGTFEHTDRDVEQYAARFQALTVLRAILYAHCPNDNATR